MRKGFSLVELSIVLVILGLLVGGILAGRSLIRAAEMRAVLSERDRYITATHTFRDKYFGLPGDITNAYTFWGVAGGCTNATVPAVPAGGETGCNGNGDGRISNNFGEGYRAWWMLQSANLIEGWYTAAGGIPNSNTPGTDVPASRMSRGGWSIQTSQFAVLPMGWGSYGLNTNWLMFGSASGGNATINAILKPEEAWNIDTKTDDGMPGTGRAMGGDAWTGAAFTNRCTTAQTATATYDFANSGIMCNMAFAF